MRRLFLCSCDPRQTWLSAQVVECRTFDKDHKKMRKRRRASHDIQDNRTLICEDFGDWIISDHGTRQCSIAAGLVDKDGSSTGLTVDLSFRMDGAHKRRLFVFTLMRPAAPRPERLFQLAVNQGPQPPKDAHYRSHEHVKGSRVNVPAILDDAPFSELLEYFCGRTNLTFRPVPGDPAKLFARKR